MESQYQLSDNELVTQFKNRTLNPKLFSHEAHLRLAWIHIKNHGIDNAIDTITHQLISFVSFLGENDKYNETVTIAAIRAVYHFMLKSKSHNFKDFIEEFPRLKYNFKELLEQHYNIDIFNSEIAKSSVLETEILPFD